MENSNNISAVEFLHSEYKRIFFYESITPQQSIELSNVIEKAKEIEEKNLLEMLHKFGFDYTYNYRGEKTIYEWIPEWFEEYKRLLTI